MNERCDNCYGSGYYEVTIGLSPIGDEIEKRICTCKAGEVVRLKRQEYLIEREYSLTKELIEIKKELITNKL